MTKQPIIDAHVHLWDLRTTPREASAFVKLFGWHPPLMNWLADKVFPKDAAEFFGGPSQVLSDYLPSHHSLDTAARGVEGFVHIEAGWKAAGPMGPVDETRWLESLSSPTLKAIVGTADLRLGESVREVLEAHLAASPRVRGIRHPLSHHPNRAVWGASDRADLMNDEQWRRGFAELARLGLSFDASVYHHQLDALFDLARDFPRVVVVVGHGGTPTAHAGPYAGEGATEDERREIDRAWRASMLRLAELPNVNVKISGLSMPILGWGYHRGAAPDATRVANDLRPLIDFLIDGFGADRCMFGSNFPVDRVSLPFTTLYDALDAIMASRSEAERAALFGGTAMRVYRIETSD